MNRQYRRRFHDDQFYAVGQEQDLSWFARLLWPLFSGRVHKGQTQGEAFGQAVEETEEIRKRKRK
jgi:hypothetical protein